MLETPLSGDETFLKFQPLGADLGLQARKDLPKARSLQFSVRPIDFIKFSNGTSLDETDWKIVVNEGEFHNKHAAEMGVIGLLSGPWTSKEETFREGLLMIALGTTEFESLLSAVLSGRLPLAIQVTFDSIGLKMEDTNSRGVIWDLAKDSTPRVVSVYIHTPLLKPETNAAGEGVPPPTSPPASKSDIDALAKSIREALLAGQSQVRSIAIGAAIVALLVLFFRH